MISFTLGWSRLCQAAGIGLALVLAGCGSSEETGADVALGGGAAESQRVGAINDIQNAGPQGTLQLAAGEADAAAAGLKADVPAGTGGVSSARRPETPARGSAAQPRSDKDEVAVTIPAGDGQMANCAIWEVAGLAPRGDGFLAVRAGPGTNYRELNRLYNGQKVLRCDGRGDWAGIVYPADSPVCNTEGAKPRQLPYDGPCRSGWVHGSWIRLLAG